MAHLEPTEDTLTSDAAKVAAVRDWVERSVHGGMSVRQYAAIALRVPDSGDEWLDKMIREARLMDFAVRAPLRVLKRKAKTLGSAADNAYDFAYVMLAQKRRREGGDE